MLLFCAELRFGAKFLYGCKTDRPFRTIWIGVGLLAGILGLAFWVEQFEQPPAAPLPSGSGQ